MQINVFGRYCTTFTNVFYKSVIVLHIVKLAFKSSCNILKIGRNIVAL